MARRMLIDASHPEETRVVVVDGTRLEEFDFETASRKPLKGNIYLAKVIRIEPSLQAAFVEYGGNRHGFLAFSEIHPDYYQIPVADRERLIAEQQRLHAEAEEDEPRRSNRIDRTDIEEARADIIEAAADEFINAAVVPDEAPAAEAAAVDPVASETPAREAPAVEAAPADSIVAEAAPVSEPEPQTQPAEIPVERLDGPVHVETAETPVSEPAAMPAIDGEMTAVAESAEQTAEQSVELNGEASPSEATDPAEAPQPDVTVETLGGDDVVEERETRERRRRNPIRQYKIQEVIKRRQILLVQVVKEERGNKGAALTTYLSLAGRYCVLMPNAGRGGGISRKISNPSDRKRMKEILSDLDVPQGMGVILRTAGLERSNIDIKRDYEYLSRLWDSIREITMRSTAPALIYEEGDLIKRSLRDIYDTDIAQVLVEGEAGFQSAAEFMRQLVPHQANKVELYREPIPLFHRYQVENQFDAMHSPTVQLRSGGYIVINPTEALVAIDVNSGRSTKERNIEETALRTNLEAAEEIARQVRLRDLAGLIVIDFIDMEESRHQRQVEHKVKDSMRSDRARIQIGRISAFGLLEMSRQRLRPSLLEHSTEVCPHCAGTGRIRSLESAALHALRAIEEEGVRRRASEIAVSVPPNVALYLLNQKRHSLSEIEQRYGFTVIVEADEDLHAADCEIERVRSRREDHRSGERPAPELARASYEETSGDEVSADEAEVSEAREGEERDDERSSGEDGEGRPRSRRRRRRRRTSSSTSRREDGENPDQPQASGEAREVEAARTDEQPVNGDDEDEPEDNATDGDSEIARADDDGSEAEAEGDRPDGERNGEDRSGSRRRRGRRGGRRRRREPGEGETAQSDAESSETQTASQGDELARNGHDTSEPTGSHEPPPSPPTPLESMPVEHTPMERAPYDPGPPVNVEAAPPPPQPAPEPEPVVASAPQPIAVPEPEPVPTPPPPPVPVIDAPPEKPKRGWWRR
ncbi:Rne/Rng family ribonuclease [Reyranella sp.]|uniref:Rne/Rng family ribonuclease n=1 Tax=Reyranella sp. TaxID=1929291 RepID=UPI00271FFF74|nr:Rne/Rng family ribonuclease [Reyranella sp.]MDO8974618.1 Rne/Rng family ribonuclease [Reyranella sp.]